MNSSFKQGLFAAWPICLGYFAIGLAFGVLAEKAGLAPWQIGLMSLFVYAGSSQFVAVAMMSGGASVGAVVLATFIINLRHLLMSSSLSVYLKGMGHKWLPLFAYGITDESFAVNMTRFREGQWDWQRALVVNHVSNLAWIMSTILGGYAGQFIPPEAFGLDYALTAMFISLLMFQLQSREYVIVAALAGILAVLISFALGGYTYMLAAPLLAAPVGLLMRLNRQSSRKEG